MTTAIKGNINEALSCLRVYEGAYDGTDHTAVWLDEAIGWMEDAIAAAKKLRKEAHVHLPPEHPYNQG